MFRPSLQDLQAMQPPMQNAQNQMPSPWLGMQGQAGQPQLSPDDLMQMQAMKPPMLAQNDIPNVPPPTPTPSATPPSKPLFGEHAGGAFGDRMRQSIKNRTKR